jgi:hypothetical protein
LRWWTEWVAKAMHGRKEEYTGKNAKQQHQQKKSDKWMRDDHCNFEIGEDKEMI